MAAARARGRHRHDDGHDPRRSRGARHPATTSSSPSARCRQATATTSRKTIDDLRARDLVYEGRLPPPKGQQDEDWEDREQTLFRATAFGDDVDRPLLKSDGSLHLFRLRHRLSPSKFERGFAQMIDVWGADHGGYVKRMQAAVKAVTDGKGDLDVKLCQLVKLLRDGEPVKMSKRSGDFVTLREVVDEVGRDAVRFMMLFRKNDATARLRPRQGGRAIEGQPGLLRAIRPCALRVGVPAGEAKSFPEADFVGAGRWRQQTCRSRRTRPRWT